MVSKNLSKRTFLFLIVGAIVLFILQWYSFKDFSFRKDFSLYQDKSSPKILGEAHLIVDDGNGSKREFAGPTVEDMYIWQAILQAADAGSLNVSYKIENKSFILRMLNGKGEPNGVWAVYRNEQLLDPREIIEESLMPGDLVKLVYVKN